MSAGSIERLLRHLSRLDKQAAEGDIKHTGARLRGTHWPCCTDTCPRARAVRLTEAHALGPESIFIDVGSGSGKARANAAHRARRAPQRLLRGG